MPGKTGKMKIYLCCQVQVGQLLLLLSTGVQSRISGFVHSNPGENISIVVLLILGGLFS